MRFVFKWRPAKLWTNVRLWIGDNRKPLKQLGGHVFDLVAVVALLVGVSLFSVRVAWIVGAVVLLFLSFRYFEGE